ncbi:hypothetical protein HMPREF9421_1240 [Streptococcus australis ATCC 700641]|uniref:Uncharacterized protein n=1 Tax=Streptococcus australis ATCC 700641 TaxID=888833 RepID=E7SAM3_9STRE|nr:hypothetical protein HMPREF9421_1240 [Streptococcus australis ATCC 700641]
MYNHIKRTPTKKSSVGVLFIFRFLKKTLNHVSVDTLYLYFS